MKVIFNTAVKPAVIQRNPREPVLKGEKQEVEIKPQVNQDTFEQTPKCEGDACKK